jgi:hypothetical protein
VWVYLADQSGVGGRGAGGVCGVCAVWGVVTGGGGGLRSVVAEDWAELDYETHRLMVRATKLVGKLRRGR